MTTESQAQPLPADIQGANDAILEMMMADAEAAPFPSPPTAVVHRGDGDQPLPQVLNTVNSPGYYYLYNTRTGEPSRVLGNMLKAQLSKKYPDGTRVFTPAKPMEGPYRGTIKCQLHAEHPNREQYAAWGFATCHKATLPSEYQLNQHMRVNHSAELATIQQALEAEEKDIDRQLQRDLIKATSDASKTTRKRRAKNKE